MIARDLMTPDPVTVTPETSIAEAWDLMRLLASRHLPVVEGQTLVGMVSDRDLSRIDLAGILASEGAEALRAKLATPVGKMMTANVISVDTEAGLGDVVNALIEHKVGALAIVRPGSRDLVGILSYIDVLKIVQHSLSHDRPRG